MAALPGTPTNGLYPAAMVDKPGDISANGTGSARSTRRAGSAGAASGM